MTVNLSYFVTSLGDFLANNLFNLIKSKQNYKIHDYRKKNCELDYSFSSMDGGLWGYMTAQKHGVNKGDRILLMQNSRTIEYRVEEIDYYSNPPDMWIALLKIASTDDKSFSITNKSIIKKNKD
jgi:MioC protein